MQQLFAGICKAEFMGASRSAGNTHCRINRQRGIFEPRQHLATEEPIRQSTPGGGGYRCQRAASGDITQRINGFDVGILEIVDGYQAIG